MNLNEFRNDDKPKFVFVFNCLKSGMGRIHLLVDKMECPEAYAKQIRIDEHMYYYIYQELIFMRA